MSQYSDASQYGDRMETPATAYSAPTKSTWLQHPLSAPLMTVAAAIAFLAVVLIALAGGNSPAPIVVQVPVAAAPAAAPAPVPAPSVTDTTNVALLPVGCNTAQNDFITSTLAWTTPMKPLEYSTEGLYTAPVPGTDISVVFSPKSCWFFLSHNYEAKANIDGSTPATTIQDLSYKGYPVKVTIGSSCFYAKGDVPTIKTGANGTSTIVSGNCDDVV